MSIMRNLLFFTAMSIILTAVLTGCGRSKIDRLYNTSHKTVTESRSNGAEAAVDFTNADDSIAYLMGYIYGESFGKTLEKEEKRGLTTDRQQFETGVAMVLHADSSDISLLKGIMMGITLRQALERLDDDTSLDWDSTLAYKGMYDGLNRTVVNRLPIDAAEESLNRLLYRYFSPADTTKRNKKQ